MICEAGLELHARCQATPLSLPDPCDRQLLTRVPFPPTPGLGTSFSFTLPELPSLTHCSHGPAPASLLWGPSVDAAPGTPGPHLGHTWATPEPHLGQAIFLLTPQASQGALLSGTASFIFTGTNSHAWQKVEGKVPTRCHQNHSCVCTVMCTESHAHFLWLP